MLKRSINILGHSTSISLEEEFWEALKAIAKDKKVSLAGLVAAIDGASLRDEKRLNLSSRVRVYILEYFMGKS